MTALVPARPAPATAPLIEVAWILRGLHARAGLLLVIASAGIAATLLTAALLPPVFRAEARVLVEGPQVPAELARSTITASAAERLALIEERLMTRRNLLEIAERLSLFAGQSRPGDSDIVEHMRRATELTSISFNKNPRYRGPTVVSAFTIAFSDREPERAMRVTEELVRLALAHNARTRTVLADEANDFFRGEVARLAAVLAEKDDEIAGLRTTSERATPKGRARYLADMAATQTALDRHSATLAGLERRRDAALDAGPGPEDPAQIDMLIAQKQARIRGTRRRLAQMDAVIDRVAQLDSALAALQRERTALQAQYQHAVNKRADAERGRILEQNSNAERFEVIEPARVPERPVAPKRTLIVLVGAALSIGLAIVAVTILEAASGVVRTGDDLIRMLRVGPVVSFERMPGRAAAARRGALRRVLVLVLTAGFVWLFAERVSG